MKTNPFKHNHQLFLQRGMLLIAVLFSFMGLQAQEPVQLNLKDAVNYAVKANQNAKKARLDEENSQYKIDEVRARALPQINGSPAPVTVCAGSNVQFAVSASGQGLNYQWQVSANNGGSWSSIGINSNTLNLNNVSGLRP